MFKQGLQLTPVGWGRLPGKIFTTQFRVRCQPAEFCLVSSPDPPRHAPSENFQAWRGGSGDETTDFVYSRCYVYVIFNRGGIAIARRIDMSGLRDYVMQT